MTTEGLSDAFRGFYFETAPFKVISSFPRPLLCLPKGELMEDTEISSQTLSAILQPVFFGRGAGCLLEGADEILAVFKAGLEADFFDRGIGQQ